MDLPRQATVIGRHGPGTMIHYLLFVWGTVLGISSRANTSGSCWHRFLPDLHPFPVWKNIEGKQGGFFSPLEVIQGDRWRLRDRAEEKKRVPTLGVTAGHSWSLWS